MKPYFTDDITGEKIQQQENMVAIHTHKTTLEVLQKIFAAGITLADLEKLAQSQLLEGNNNNNNRTVSATTAEFSSPTPLYTALAKPQKSPIELQLSVWGCKSDVAHFMGNFLPEKNISILLKDKNVESDAYSVCVTSSWELAPPANGMIFLLKTEKIITTPWYSSSYKLNEESGDLEALMDYLKNSTRPGLILLTDWEKLTKDCPTTREHILSEPQNKRVTQLRNVLSSLKTLIDREDTQVILLPNSGFDQTLRDFIMQKILIESAKRKLSYR